jgi:hypothetical protein
MGDGWFCRMERTPGTTSLVKDRWIPIHKSQAAAQAKQGFYNYFPQNWDRYPERLTGRFYVHPQFNMEEDGNGTAHVGLIDDEQNRVYLWLYFNF